MSKAPTYSKTDRATRCGQARSTDLAPPPLLTRNSVAWLRCGAVGLLLAIGFTPPRVARADESQQQPDTPLARKQGMVRDRFDRFEDRLFQLRSRLADTDPKRAERLERALRRAGELGLSAALDDIMDMLRDPARLPEAARAQEAWLQDAERVMAILLASDADNEQRDQNIQSLEETRQQVDELLTQQRALQDATRHNRAAPLTTEQIDAAIEEVNQLTRHQSDLLAEASRAFEDGPSQPSAPSTGKQQQDLSSQTEQLAKRLGALADLADFLPGDNPSPSTTPPPPQQPPQDRSPGDKIDQAADALTDSAASMAQAADALQDAAANNQPIEKQREALDALTRAAARLAEARKKAEQAAGQAKLGDAQRMTADATRDLADSMQDAAHGTTTPGSPNSLAPHESSGQSLNRAEQHMRRAADNLDANESDQAAGAQDKAIDELEQARRDLDNTLQQLRMEEKEEMLRDLQRRFRAMHTEQQAIKDQTVSLDASAATSLSRADQLTIADLTVRQQRLADQAQTCRQILADEGTTIVFPYVVTQIAEDMTVAATRLAQEKIGLLTQAVQQEIIDALAQLLQAASHMQQEGERQSGKTTGQQLEPPLLPTSAELKLLRAGQKRINDRTAAIETLRQLGAEPVDALRQALDVVARRQQECAKIARQIQDKTVHPAGS